MREIMTNQATSCDLKELVRKFIPEMIGKEIEKATSSIYPLQNVFIRKVKILKAPKFDLGKLMEVYPFIIEDLFFSGCRFPYIIEDFQMSSWCFYLNKTVNLSIIPFLDLIWFAAHLCKSYSLVFSTTLYTTLFGKINR